MPDARIPHREGRTIVSRKYITIPTLLPVFAAAVLFHAALGAEDMQIRNPVQELQTASVAPVLPGTVSAGTGTEYELSPDGLLTAVDTATGETRVLNESLPVKVVYPFTPDLRDPVFTWATDPSNRSRLAVTTARGINLSADGGRTWIELPTDKVISPNIHFTAVALSPFSPSGFLAGTSFDGMYETTDGGKTWKSLTEKAGLFGKGSGFYEEVSALAYDPADRASLYMAVGFGGSLYRYDRKTEKWSGVELPAGESGKTIVHLDVVQEGTFILTSPSRKLVVRTASSTLVYRIADRAWEPIEPAVDKPTGARASDAGTGTSVSPERAARRALASGKNGIYLNAEQARSPKLDAHLQFIAEHGMNSLVVDFKDDFGYVTYDSSLELPKKAGAFNTRFKASELIKKAHDRGLYLVARIVVFKDRQLYRYDGSRFALQDRYTGKAWGDLKTVTDPETGETKQEQLEFWVDPFCEDVWNYNIAIAVELQSLGVDEIQFDYIRFPSDGDTSRIKSRHQRDGMTRSNALESFLKRAREAISIPMGTDVYGFNAWFRMKYIGQDIGVYSRYVDVISPMFYPSHFPREFLGSMQYFPRAEYIYGTGTNRAIDIVGNRCVIRPYIQSFLIGGELKFEKPAYTEYLTRQLDGLAKSAGSGFTLWNASGRYYMVTPSIKRYTGTATDSALLQ